MATTAAPGGRATAEAWPHLSLHLHQSAAHGVKTYAGKRAAAKKNPSPTGNPQAHAIRTRRLPLQRRPRTSARSCSGGRGSARAGDAPDLRPSAFICGFSSATGNHGFARMRHSEGRRQPQGTQRAQRIGKRSRRTRRGRSTQRAYRPPALAPAPALPFVATFARASSASALRLQPKPSTSTGRLAAGPAARPWPAPSGRVSGSFPVVATFARTSPVPALSTSAFNFNRLASRLRPPSRSEARKSFVRPPCNLCTLW